MWNLGNFPIVGQCLLSTKVLNWRAYPKQHYLYDSAGLTNDNRACKCMCSSVFSSSAAESCDMVQRQDVLVNDGKNRSIVFSPDIQHSNSAQIHKLDCVSQYSPGPATDCIMKADLKVQELHTWQVTGVVYARSKTNVGGNAWLWYFFFFLIVYQKQCSKTHLVCKELHHSYLWLCAFGCDALWHPLWCHNGKHRALMEKFHWSSSSWCTPYIDRQMIKGKSRKAKRKTTLSQ